MITRPFPNYEGDPIMKQQKQLNRLKLHARGLSDIFGPVVSSSGDMMGNFFAWNGYLPLAAYNHHDLQVALGGDSRMDSLSDDYKTACKIMGITEKEVWTISDC